MSLRSPIRRVLGLGAAKEGVSHWWGQRVSAVALAVLTVWFVAAFLLSGNFAYEAVVAWLSKPVNAVLMVLLVATLVYHSQLGVQVVIEDYVHHPGVKIVTMLAVNFIHIVIAALGVFAVLRIAVGGAA